MSVLVNLAIFPVDKGSSVSTYVARVIRIIKASGLPYRFGPMSTCIEGEWDEVMGVVRSCFEELRKDSERIYLSLNADYRKGPSGRIESKVKSVEEKL
ncbi:MAG: MTH1187 family thiamine-binding protein [Deltaproteobacteria bacterium]|nr:MTH1187 family thiamine-binding protein [Deltaproteobacteria bacterium]